MTLKAHSPVAFLNRHKPVGRFCNLVYTTGARLNVFMEGHDVTPTIRVVRRLLTADSRGESFFVAEFSHTGHEHRAEGKSLQEAVGKLVCEHPDC
jgi:hypothetical protein